VNDLAAPPTSVTSRPPRSPGGTAGFVFSFFSGAGLMDLGFEQAGFTTAMANEFHPAFLQGYRHARRSLGLPEPLLGHVEGSIEQFSAGPGAAGLSRMVSGLRATGRAVGFIGGPPCPDFSIAGLNRGEAGAHGRLSGVYAALICEQQPDFFVLENVRGLWGRHRPYLEQLQLQLLRAGYALQTRLCNALEYGVPQDRSRVFVVGLRRASFPGATLEDDAPGFWDAELAWSLDEVMAMPWPGSEPFLPGSARAMPPGAAPELTVEHWFRRNGVENHPNAQHRFKVKAGGVRMAAIDEGNSRGKSFKRLHRWRYSGTAAYGHNEVHLHPYEVRRLSVAEVLAVQSAPADFSLPGSMSLSDMFRTVANGVPPLMARGVATSVRRYLNTLG